MSDPAQVNALKEIARSVKEMTRVLTTVNTNMAEVGRLFKTWLDATDEVTDHAQLSLDLENTRRIEIRYRFVLGNIVNDEMVAEGLLRKLSENAYQIEVARTSEGNAKIFALPPNSPWQIMMFCNSKPMAFDIPSFESEIDRVYGRIHGDVDTLVEEG